MRTAETIWEEELILWETTNGGSLDDHVRHAINKSRIEAIQESSNQITENVYNGGFHLITSDLKSKILSLIKEVK